MQGSSEGSDSELDATTPKKARLEGHGDKLDPSEPVTTISELEPEGNIGKSSRTRRGRGRGRGKGRGRGRGRGKARGTEASSSHQAVLQESTLASSSTGRRGRRRGQRIQSRHSETDEDQAGPSAPLTATTTPTTTITTSVRRKGTRKTKSAGGRNIGPQNLRSIESDADRINNLREKRKQKMQDDISKMTRQEIENLLFKAIERRPGMVFDVMYASGGDGSAPSGSPPSPCGEPGLHWCRCGNCRDMPTDAEKLCCGKSPEECVREHAVFQMITDEVCLLLQRAIWVDAYNLEGESQEPGEDNKCMRHAAYRSFIFWQHGKLGQSNRRVIPSCCVLGIRRMYPSINGHYTGYIPGSFV
ncbi:uncharacterized protein LOC129261234 [Lytechinus pictus]|uniref:uncharacterized protein LOC129261234 n=1 Tax=Lytechinus pictus TaxID=7653 RepID=UPI0030B9C42F